MITLTQAISSRDTSKKYVFENEAGNLFESVYFRLPPDNGADREYFHMCISSQAGCAMGCSFCATAAGGFFSNLTASEMEHQIDAILDDLRDSGVEDDAKFNIVFMGMGEPLANLSNVIRFCERGRSKYKNLREFSISTVGIANRFGELAEYANPLGIKLTVSLHSPFDEERTSIIPMNKSFNINRIVQEATCFWSKTGKKVNISYLMLKDFNDSAAHARALAALLDPGIFSVQILLYNEEIGSKFSRPEFDVASRFLEIMQDARFDAYIQQSQARDIDGGCGQLVKRIKKELPVKTIQRYYPDDPISTFH